MISKKLWCLIALAIVSVSVQTKDNDKDCSWHAQHKKRKDITRKYNNEEQKELDSLNQGECKDRSREAECQHKRDQIRYKYAAEENKEKEEAADACDNSYRERHNKRKAEYNERKAKEHKKKAEQSKKDKKRKDKNKKDSE